MSQAYIRAIEDHCLSAVLVLERFHIAKALNEAIDKVRKEQLRHAVFTNMIFLSVANLDISAQIPAKFRSI